MGNRHRQLQVLEVIKKYGKISTIEIFAEIEGISQSCVGNIVKRSEKLLQKRRDGRTFNYSLNLEGEQFLYDLKEKHMDPGLKRLKIGQERPDDEIDRIHYEVNLMCACPCICHHTEMICEKCELDYMF